jgi:hypothetical protein
MGFSDDTELGTIVFDLQEINEAVVVVPQIGNVKERVVGCFARHESCPVHIDHCPVGKLGDGCCG